MNPIIAINYYFSEGDLANRIFSPDSKNMLSPYMRAFRDFMAARSVDVVTLDTVDFNDPNVKSVLYFEYNWRLLSRKRDSFLARVPYEKRALVLLEPAIVNPSMYYTGFLRDRFKTVFTWDLRLLERNPGYIPIRVPTGADPEMYKVNPFRDTGFADKKLLVAVSRNRSHYMPQATFGERRRVYRFMQREAPGEFDLYGQWWDRPCSVFEKLLGHDYSKCWKGEIAGSWDEKVAVTAKYRFAVCFENSVGNPGYVSEKIFDCFCGRTVPVYLGSKGNEAILPPGTYIDYRDFGSPGRLLPFLRGMDECTYDKYIEAIDRFLESDGWREFSAQNLYQAVFDNLVGGVD